MTGPSISPPTTSPVSGPKPIAFCITELDPGGAERALFQLVTRLPPVDWLPVVYCLGPETELARKLQSRGVPVECYGATSWRDLGAVCWLRRRLRSQRPVLLQTVLFHANLMGRIAGRLAGVPVILAGHRVAEKERRWHGLLDRMTKRLVDHHLCVSRGVADYVQTRLGVPASSISIAPNGVEPFTLTSQRAAVREEWGCSEETTLILAAGRLHPQKGFPLLLEAFSRVAAQHPDSLLLIAGDGPQRQNLEQKIASLQLEGRVHLLGYREDLPRLMAGADLFALSSQWEGMPNVVLEAMSAGLPVLSTRVEGIDELLSDGVTGIVVTAGDVDSFAGGLGRLLDQPELRTALGTAAQDFVLKHFTWESCVQETVALYRRLLS